MSLEGREAQLAAVAEALERDLQLLGATAVEDRLQEGVPAAIAGLLAAGLKVPVPRTALTRATLHVRLKLWALRQLLQVAV